MNNILPAISGAAAGYLYANIPPYHDRTKGKASVLVLSCIDPRYTNDLAFFLTHSQELHADYDLICLAGASIGVFHSDCWASMFYEHIDLGIKLHGVKEVWCFNHMDCGMAKATFDVKEDTESMHLKSINDLKANLKEKYPELKFQGYMIDLNGHIKKVASE